MDEPSDEPSDWRTRETLLQRVKDPEDEESWKEFVYYYKQYIYNIVRRMNMNHHDAEEIVQVVNVKMWEKLPEFKYDKEKGRFRGWLCTVTGNEVKQLLRKRKRMLNNLQNQEKLRMESYLDQVVLPAVDKIAEREWRAYITKLAWDRIGDQFEAQTKAVFERVSMGEKPEEIAKDLGISQSSVYVYKKRVQDRLREEVMELNRELD
jgi:RNA polymerase sigma factor (sigma-70 family)